MPSAAGDETSFLLGAVSLLPEFLPVFPVNSGNLFIDFENDLCLICRKREQAKIHSTAHISLYERCISRSSFILLSVFIVSETCMCCILMPYFHVRLQAHYTEMFFLTSAMIVKAPVPQFKHVNNYSSE